MSPQSNGSSPTVWVRVTVLDVLRDLSSVESPDGNVRVIPKHSEDTTGGLVEGMTSTSFGVNEGATIVVTGRALALSRDGGSKEALSGRAVSARINRWDVGVRVTGTTAGMESVLVLLDIVDALNDIDLKEGLGFGLEATGKEWSPLRQGASFGYESRFQVNLVHQKT